MTKTLIRWWDFPAVLRLIAIFWLAGLTLQVTRWTPGLNLVSLLTILGCLTGFIIGLSDFRGWNIFWLESAMSLAIVPVILGFTQKIEGGLLERQYVLFRQFGVTLTDFLQNQPATDPTLFIMVTSLFLWSIGLTGGISLIRKQTPWVSIFFASVGIFTLSHYSADTAQVATFTAFFIIAIILLKTRLNYLQLRGVWQRTSVKVDSEEGFDLNRNIILSITVIILLAWNIPLIQAALTPGTVENRQFSQYIEDFQQRFGNVVAPLNNPSGPSVNGYNQNLFFSTETPDSSNIVFYAEPSYALPSGGRFYWRGWVYDTYEADQWVDDSSYRRSFSPFEVLQSNPDWLSLQQIQVEFRVQQLLGNYFTTGNPYALNSEGRVYFPSIIGSNEDLAAVLPVDPLQPGEVYSVISNLGLPSQYELMNAGDDYPSWVLERYLQLPIGFSERIRDLATAITTNIDTPYEQVVAITNYLRSTMSYSDSVPVPPPGRDMVEWFLFDFKTGFCTYYASAEVLMLRSIGIPARLAVGFSQGVPIEEGRIFQVRQRDTHAWPEVFFPGYGWIVFEPTSALPEPVLPLGIETGGEEIQEPETSAPVHLPQTNLNQYDFGDTPYEVVGILPASERNDQKWIWVLITISLGFMGIALYHNKNKWIKPAVILLNRIIQLPKQPAPEWLLALQRNFHTPPIVKSFKKISWALQFLGKPASPSMTAKEQVILLSNILPGVKPEAEILLEAYHQFMFRQMKIDPDPAKRAGRRLQRMVIFAWMQRWLNSPSHTIGNKPNGE